MVEFINIDEVNRKLKANDMKVIYDAESQYRGQLFQLVQKILKLKVQPQVILLAGPSCAGKTTTARLLKEILESKKKKAIIVSMDDFFVNREDTPLLPNGMKDYDSLRTVNLPQIEDCFKTLFTYGEAGFPRFDFISGLNLPNEYYLHFDKNTYIIFEGLHALNPEITKHLGTDRFYKIYTNALMGFKRDEFYKINAVNLRLIRRMIRDVKRRGTPPEDTMKSWHNVCDAEESYITPYRDSADAWINTTHTYELALYKNEFFEIVMKNREIMQDLTFLEIFEDSTSLDKRKLPDTSLMWEFIDKPEVEDEEEKKEEKKQRKTDVKVEKKKSTK